MTDALPIPTSWITQGGAVTLLALVVFMILKGWLVPLRFYKQLEAERDAWRRVAEKSLGHTETMLPAARVATDFVREFAKATGVHTNEESEGER